MDKHSKAIWGTSQVIVEGDFKPGGTALVTFEKTAGRVKESGSDPLGRWTYQNLDGKGNKEVLVMNVYQCCTNKQLCYQKWINLIQTQEEILDAIQWHL
jgi:hypothetical protein